MPGNPRKKERFGMVSGGRWRRAHYEGEGVEGERGRGGEVLPKWRRERGAKPHSMGRG